MQHSHLSYLNLHLSCKFKENICSSSSKAVASSVSSSYKSTINGLRKDIKDSTYISNVLRF